MISSPYGELFKRQGMKGRKRAKKRRKERKNYERDKKQSYGGGKKEKWVAKKDDFVGKDFWKLFMFGSGRLSMSMERYTTPEKVTSKNDKICLYLFVKALKVFVFKALR